MPQKSRIAFILVLFIFIAGNAEAQNLGDYLRRLDVGAGASILPFEVSEDSPGDLRSETFYRFNLAVGLNLPVVTVAKETAIGIAPFFYGLIGENIFGYTPSRDRDFNDPLYDPFEESEGPNGAAMAFPVFITLKHGADATYYGESIFGFGFGAGYQHALLFTGTEEILGVGTPAVMAEVSIKTKQPFLRLRYIAPIGKHEFDAWHSINMQSINLFCRIEL